MSKEAIVATLRNFSSHDSRIRAVGQTETNQFDLSITLFVTQLSLFSNIAWLDFLPHYQLVKSNLSTDATTPMKIQLKFEDGIELSLVIAPVFTRRSFLASPGNKIIASKD